MLLPCASACLWKLYYRWFHFRGSLHMWYDVIDSVKVFRNPCFLIGATVCTVICWFLAFLYTYGKNMHTYMECVVCGRFLCSAKWHASDCVRVYGRKIPCSHSYCIPVGVTHFLSMLAGCMLWMLVTVLTNKGSLSLQQSSLLPDVGSNNFCP